MSTVAANCLQRSVDAHRSTASKLLDSHRASATEHRLSGNAGMAEAHEACARRCVEEINLLDMVLSLAAKLETANVALSNVATVR